MITIGLDIGSLATKGVAINGDGEILGYDIDLTGGDNMKATRRVFDKILEKTGLREKDVSYVMSTGYGREQVPFANGYVTEITCHALGINFLFPEVRTILDIGGQDSKAIRINQHGMVGDFIMNDKCAAGTGRFLEVIANALKVNLSELGALSDQAEKQVSISNMCTVFAESEVVSLVAKGTYIPDIISGVHEAIATRAFTLLNRIGLKEPVAMSGGVAKNKGVVNKIENKLNQPLCIPEEPQITGALGAALIGRKKMK